VVYHLLDSRPCGHIREDVRKREIADLRNQLLVHSRPEGLEGGEVLVRGWRKDCTVILISKNPALRVSDRVLSGSALCGF